MKDINEILRKKEVDLQQLHREVDALRTVARLLSEETEAATVYPPRTVASANPYAPPPRPAPPHSVSANDPGLGASWDAAAKKFP
jgi:hypothetical protein